MNDEEFLYTLIEAMTTPIKDMDRKYDILEYTFVVNRPE